MVRTLRFVQRSLVSFILGAGVLSLGCASKNTGNVTIEPPYAINLRMSTEPTLVMDTSVPEVPWAVMTVNDIVQIHAIDPRTNIQVDGQVTWSVGPSKYTTDPSGAIDQKGKYTAPSSPSYVGVGATADSSNPPLRGSIGIEIVAAPVLTSFTASAMTVSSGQSVSLTPTFTNGKGQLLVGSQVVLTGLISGAPVSLTPAATTTYTLVVTNLAGASVHQDLQIIVQ